MMTNRGIDQDLLDDDVVQCSFFLTSEVEDLTLTDLCLKINDLIKSLSQGYIWHQDKFTVQSSLLNSEMNIPFHLFSHTCYGDNVEDEWFIVFLIFEISKIYPELVIQVRDSDGEFLLIEAANYLPKWINPETSENRVYIHQNKLHLIPQSLASMDTKLSINDAINFIKDGNNSTIAANMIQQAIRDRIGNTSEKYLNSFHYAVVTIPIDVATILSLDQNLVAPLVHSYCQRDIFDAKKCANIKLEQLVTVKVKFTKCLYAMIMHAKPYDKNKIKSATRKRDTIGKKLALGYAALVSQSPNNIFSTKQYMKFLENLKSNGYFQKNLEHSKQYNYLLDKAKDFFSATEVSTKTQVCNKIHQLISSDNFNKIKQKIVNQTEEYESDNDDWLQINPEQLTNLLNSRYGDDVNFKTDDVINADQVTNKLSVFLNQTSDYEGIEPNHESNMEKIQFDPDDFMNSVEKMLNILTTEDAYLSESEDSSVCSEGSVDIDKEIEQELSTKLKRSDETIEQGSIFHNMKKSIKQEKGFSGPSSNVLSNVGIFKTEMLSDSDDD